MEPFTTSATLEHIVFHILEADTAKAAYHQAMHALGTESVTDAMMFRIEDLTVDWIITT